MPRKIFKDGCGRTPYDFRKESELRKEKPRAFASWVANGVEQPCAGKSPVGLHRGNRAAEGLGDFLVGHTAKIPKLHDLSLDGVLQGKLLKRFVHREQFIIIDRSRQSGFLEGDALVLAAVPQGSTPPRTVNENPTHSLRCHSKEVRAIFKALITCTNKFQ